MRHFFVTAWEMRQAGIRVHEEIADHTRFTAPSIKQLMERVRISYRFREDHIADGKCAEHEGDWDLAQRCHTVVNEITEVFAIWKARWRAARSTSGAR